MSRNLEKVEEKKSNTKKSVAKGKKTAKKTSNTSAIKSSDKKVEKFDNSITLEEAESFYHISLLAQTTCVVGVLFLTILAIFEHSFTVPIEVLIGITLLIMAFNNFKVFKRKGLTLVYLVFGIICLIVGFLGYFGVNV